MRKILALITMLLLFAGFAAAQTAKPAAKPKPATPAPAVSQPASPVAAVPAALTAAEVEAFLKRMFGYDPNMTFQVAAVQPSRVPNMLVATVLLTTPNGKEATRWYISPDQKWMIAGELFPYAPDPYLEAREALQKKAFGPTKGPADAKFTIVEFADLECPGCARAFPMLEHLQQDYPNVKFVYQSFPLTSIHPWALAAASYLDCVQRADNDKSWVFMMAVFAHQAEIDKAVFRADGTLDEAAVLDRMKHYATMAGLDADKIGACAATPETLVRVQKSVEVAQELRVGSTPILFLNGRELQGVASVPYDTLKTLIDYEIAQSGK